MFKKIRASLLAGILALSLAVSAYAQSTSPAQRPQATTEDFSVWHKKGPSTGLIITIGVLALAIIISVVYLRQRRKE